MFGTILYSLMLMDTPVSVLLDTQSHACVCVSLFLGVLIVGD